MPETIVIRVQSPYGTKRIEINLNESSCKLFENIYETFDLPSFDFRIFKERNKRGEISSSRSKVLSSYKINHGDTLYLLPLREMDEESNDKQPTSNVLVSLPNNDVVEDSVDVHLYQVDGTIEREMDEKLCQHGTNSKCVHCSAIEPYNVQHLEDQKIKHLSFHSYLRKLSGGVDKGKFVSLENISCRIRPGCKHHPPWPKGICSKCQPNAITLNRQSYRHLDNVVFENPQLVERFLNYWRLTGNQRIGFLYGHFEPHKDVPLGIKATVTAIYEPPQASSRDMVTLLEDEKIIVVDEIAKQLGLQKVGWIFTDLVVNDMVKGTVKHFRNVNSHFLSAQECLMAGHLQNEHPNVCRLSPTGYFGSKFVTVCVTGDAQNQVHMEGYQVSNQCMALVRDDCLVPTKDAPELGYIRESTNEQYVPDVFYKEKDEYGNEVTQLARPLPIEYLLVDVPVSTPMEPQFMFYWNTSVKSFPVENRMLDGHIQDFSSLVSYLHQFPSGHFLDTASDFHFLIYVATMEMLPMKDCLGPLLEAVKTKDSSLAESWAASEQWATVEQLMAAQQGVATGMDVAGGSMSSLMNNAGSHSLSSTSSRVNDMATSSTGTGSSSGLMWTCDRCTFLNKPEGSQCDMCGQLR